MKVENIELLLLSLALAWILYKRGAVWFRLVQHRLAFTKLRENHRVLIPDALIRFGEDQDFLRREVSDYLVANCDGDWLFHHWKQRHCIYFTDISDAVQFKLVWL